MINRTRMRFKVQLKMGKGKKKRGSGKFNLFYDAFALMVIISREASLVLLEDKTKITRDLALAGHAALPLVARNNLHTSPPSANYYETRNHTLLPEPHLPLQIQPIVAALFSLPSNSYVQNSKLSMSTVFFLVSFETLTSIRLKLDSLLWGTQNVFHTNKVRWQSILPDFAFF